MIYIQEETTKNPIRLCGLESGICYGSDTSNAEKNYKRGLDCIKSGHGRVLEYPQIYMVIEDYDAKTLRELFTHIAGGPTRLQASTRYIDYSKNGFEYVIPHTIEKDNEARLKFVQHMLKTNKLIRELIDIYNVPKEDAANLLPLAMKTKVVFRTNARHLIDMSRQRTCARAYWQFRQLMQEIKQELSNYSTEWKELLDMQFGAKCEYLGYCPESKGCGRYPHKE